jgi:hypothetical protein
MLNERINIGTVNPHTSWSGAAGPAMSGLQDGVAGTLLMLQFGIYTRTAVLMIGDATVVTIG